MSGPLRIGVVGCGAISGAYFSPTRRFPGIQIVAAADLNPAAAQAKANEFSVPRVLTVDALLHDHDIQLVLNLTVPAAHASVSLAAIAAGKHVYSEKPLGITREEGARILHAAQSQQVRIGAAPDTFLGWGLQSSRKAIDDGLIGHPVAFTAFMMGRGHESWHPNPQFYYEPGGGPMFDMGPYYLTALLTFFGPVRRVTGAASVAVPQRRIASGPKKGQTIAVRTPDHMCGTIEFRNGVVGTIIQSFATWHPTYDERWPITVYGTDGTLRVPDPNRFDGPAQFRLAADTDWTDVPVSFVKGYERGVGLADMADALRSGRPHRASGELAFAVLDTMAGFFDAASSGTAYEPTAAFERPAPMARDLCLANEDR